MDDKASIRIDSILHNIDLVLNYAKGIKIEDLNEDDVLYRGICFSLAQIGEQMIALEKKIGILYPDLPWHEARVMRNFIVHDYDNTDINLISSTIKNDIPQLKKAFTKTREDFK